MWFQDLVFVLKRPRNAPLFLFPHLFIITVKTTCHLQLLNAGRSLLRRSSFDFGQKDTKFQMRQKPKPCAQIPEGARWTVKSFATASQSSLNLTNLIAADLDAVWFQRCAICSVMTHITTFTHTKTCGAVPCLHTLCGTEVMQTRWQNHLWYPDCWWVSGSRHPPTRARSLLGDVNPKLACIRFGAHAPPPTAW